MYVCICFGLVIQSMASNQQGQVALEYSKANRGRATGMAEILRMQELQRRCLLYSQLKEQQQKEANGGRLEGSSQYEDKLQGKKVIKLPGVLELKQVCVYLPNKISRGT